MRCHGNATTIAPTVSIQEWILHANCNKHKLALQNQNDLAHMQIFLSPLSVCFPSVLETHAVCVLATACAKLRTAAATALGLMRPHRAACRVSHAHTNTLPISRSLTCQPRLHLFSTPPFRISCSFLHSLCPCVCTAVHQLSVSPRRLLKQHCHSARGQLPPHTYTHRVSHSMPSIHTYKHKSHFTETKEWCLWKKV